MRYFFYRYSRKQPAKGFYRKIDAELPRKGVAIPYKIYKIFIDFFDFIVYDTLAKYRMPAKSASFYRLPAAMPNRHPQNPIYYIMKEVM